MATATLNGKLPRKQLSDQLDRMDTLMDGLADALPEAVADACRDGARQAVKDAVLEILASPELRALITEVATARAVTSPEPVISKPSIWSRVRTKLAAMRACIAEPIQKVKDAITNRVATVAATLSFAARCLMAVMPIGKVFAHRSRGWISCERRLICLPSQRFSRDCWCGSNLHRSRSPSRRSISPLHANLGIVKRLSASTV